MWRCRLASQLHESLECPDHRRVVAGAMAEPECPSEMFDFDDEIGVGL
jgi:hypothetical protein